MFFVLFVIYAFGYFSTTCGEEGLHRYKRIIGGHSVPRGTYPWAASIQAKRITSWSTLVTGAEQHYCGAALIRPDWIITAAHCLYDRGDDDEIISYLNPEMWHVRMATEKLSPGILERFKGALNRLFNSIFGQVKPQTFYHVEKIFHHLNYEPGNLEYDIALFKLKETPVLWKINHLDLIELPDKNVGKEWPRTNQKCIAAGWGCSFVDGPPTLKIQAVELPVLQPETCISMYSAYINLTDEHEFCAGYHNFGKGVCPGDSGGPLVCEDSNGDYKLAGIVSATHSKLPADYPAIFTRVSYFTKWINDVIKENEYKKKPDGLFSFIKLYN
ncbi:hypothetical protein MN116_005451 [Schistosoma mekongi]|uniref:Peptidase S1 domain-containing protein n=1 Tax=Schistosoma mekongi TaxID=38744 RepID=A0AAE1ZDV5_SCHME|nr:hypothetical protein MN116_005451 [Schistosoma mekongi]